MSAEPLTLGCPAASNIASYALAEPGIFLAYLGHCIRPGALGSTVARHLDMPGFDIAAKIPWIIASWGSYTGVNLAFYMAGN